MKSQIMLTGITIAFIATGCATPYMRDRGNDAADIFSATVGVGVGGKVRTGPLQLGLLFNCAEAGIRGGEKVKCAMFEDSEIGTPKCIDIQLGPYGVETFEGGLLAPERGKSFRAITIAYLSAPVPESIIQGNTTKRSSGKHAVYSPIPYWTEVEAVVGLGGTLRLGFNVGELLDFVLGWTTIDIFRDDMARRQPNNQIQNIQQPTVPISNVQVSEQGE